ncbi:hypothetical protein PMAYCL1PPCAC_10202, partial [Pristionchus mayeri]
FIDYTSFDHRVMRSFDPMFTEYHALGPFWNYYVPTDRALNMECALVEDALGEVGHTSKKISVSQYFSQFKPNEVTQSRDKLEEHKQQTIDEHDT